MQELKAQAPTEVTFSGIESFSKDEQPSKAYEPMPVNPEGRSKFFKEVQEEKALSGRYSMGVGSVTSVK